MVKCDLCGGALIVNAGGKSASCKVCGMEHSMERVQEMVQATKAAAAPVKPVQPVIPVQPITPVKPVQPVPPVQHVTPVKPVQPLGSVQPVVVPAANIQAIHNTTTVPVTPWREEPSYVSAFSNEDYDRVLAAKAQAKTQREIMVAEGVYKVATALRSGFNKRDYNISYGQDVSVLGTASPLSSHPYHFVIRQCGRPVLAIIVMSKHEIGAYTMQASQRACEEAGVRFMRFYCDEGFPNEETYVRNRICEALGAPIPKSVQTKKTQKKGFFGGLFG